MRFAQLRKHPTVAVAIASLAAVVAAAVPTAASAEDVLGMYLGASVGQAKVKVDTGGYTFDAFKENHSAFKAMVGVRPISPIGAELEYFDFGSPSSTTGGAPSSASQKGAAGFAVGYLPLPIGSIFVKAGLARLQSSVTGTPETGAPFCTPPQTCGTGPALFSLSRTSTSSAFGAGVQVKLGPWAIRGEVERFSVGGQNPALVSLGFLWTFF